MTEGDPASRIDRRLLWHAVLPALPTAVLVGLYFTPVSLVRCANRGLAAFGVVLAALLAGLGCAVVALRTRLSGDPVSVWWMLSAAILAVPAALLLGPLG